MLRADRPARPVPTCPIVTCATCQQPDVPVGVSTLQALPHRAPGACCSGLSCGHGAVVVGADGIVWQRPSRALCHDRAFEPSATDYGREVERWEAGAG